MSQNPNHDAYTSAESGYQPKKGRFVGLTFLLLIIAAPVVWVTWGGLNRADRVPEDSKIPWRTDYAEAKAEAIRSEKSLFIFFTASWCPPCQEMKKNTLSSDRIADAMDRFVPVMIDINQHRDIASEYRIRSIPTMVIVDETAVKRTSGYQTDRELAAWMRH